MKRNLYQALLKWKNSNKRKPLLLQGARQVGKTYLVNEFGKREYSHFEYFNFEENPGLREFFKEDMNPERIIENLGLYVGRKITSKETLIFFDEIQIAPEVLTSLKYFNEKAPEFQVIAAGSLLGVSLGKQTSFPVGKVSFMNMYPLSFTEYLQAIGEDLLIEKLRGINPAESLPDVIHEKLLRNLKLYMFLGGMPEVVQDFILNKDIQSARNIQNEIIESYQRDFSKYTDKVQAIKLSELWNSIPVQLARENKKFKYGAVKHKARASTFEQSLEWLTNAGLVTKIYNISVPKIPLSGYADRTKFKIYLHDTGLLGAMLKIPSKLILKPGKLFSDFNGAFTENFVAQELKTIGYENLYYWTSKYEAEVDFILQKEDKIFPVEVKSGTSRVMKSLRSYEEKYNPEMIFRISPRNFSQANRFINIPIYATFLLKTINHRFKNI